MNEYHNKVVISGKRTYGCSCGAEAKYNDKYDSYYCAASNEWLEPVCCEGECDVGICNGRPEKAPAD